MDLLWYTPYREPMSTCKKDLGHSSFSLRLGARERNVWSQKKFAEKLHYMHMNPLKRKLVLHPKDWPWSSFLFYSNPKHGLIRVDPVN
jgi:REP element-mobilizing transposase RayT